MMPILNDRLATIIVAIVIGVIIIDVVDINAPSIIMILLILLLFIITLLISIIIVLVIILGSDIEANVRRPIYIICTRRAYDIGSFGCGGIVLLLRRLSLLPTLQQYNSYH